MLPDLLQGNVAAIQLTSAEVRRGIHTLKLDSSNGPTGWTFASITDVSNAGGSKEQEKWLESLTAVYNLLLSGKASSNLRELWTTVREVLIFEKGKFRPIGIGDAFDRLMGRAVLKKVEDKAVAYLAPMQLGIGVRSGAEIGARLAYLSLRRRDVAPTIAGQGILTLDCRNAFNSISRGAIYDGLQKVCPELLPWFTWAYGGPVTLRWSTGEMMGVMATGVPQGHVLSGLCYALATHPCLERLKEVLEEEETVQQGYPGKLEDDSREVGKGAVTAFFDDITVTGDLEVLARVTSKVTAIFSPHGLDIQPSKSELIGRGVECAANPCGFRQREHGGKILGAPVGDDEYVEEEFRAKVMKSLPSVDAISRLDKRCAFRLLFYSYNSLLVYLSRICEFGAANPVHSALKLFDERMDQCIGALAGAEGDELERVALLRQQKHSRGGLGIFRYYGVTTERQKLMSRAVTRVFAEKHHPHLIKAMNDKEVWVDIRLGATEEVALEEEEENPVGTAPGKVQQEEQGSLARETRKVVKSILRKSFEEFHERLNGNGEDAHAAYLLSAASKGTGRWLLSTAGLEPGMGYFSGQDFGKKLRQRLLLPMWKTVENQKPPVCVCGGSNGATRTCLIQHTHHEQTCHGGNGIRTRRHHHICDLLAQLIKRIYGVTVEREVHYRRETEGSAWVRRPASDTGREKERRAIEEDLKFIVDIEYVKEGSRHMVDVGIVCPASLKAITKYHANTTEGAAAAAEEAKKGEKYGRIFPDTRRFVPFIMEATGRYGPAAAAFLEDLVSRTKEEGRKNAVQAVERFQAAVAMELARTGAWLINQVDDALQ
jgi:hypothetical protein